MAKLGRIAGPQLARTARAKQERSILAMTARQARAFLLKQESYCGIDLPEYFTFGRILSAVAKEMQGKSLSSMSKKACDHEQVNYSFLSNKDGRHAWRPFQIVHPALYVSLVENLTAPHQWKTIRERFAEFHSLASFKCLSIPLQAPPRRTDRQVQILNWWQGIEQTSIELALEYNHVFHADIADCYASIYTHSVSWAIHGKAAAKAQRSDKALLGNIVDRHIQDMRHGQTNGIPQGSVLMDFIAEMVLGYADLELDAKLKSRMVSGFRILRYRDDYRIFVQNPQVGEAVLKGLTEVLIDLGLKLSSAKTTGSSLVVSHSLKPDKRAWLRGRQSDPNLQKHLLIIHAHGSDFPNSGSLVTALTHFYETLSRARRVQNPRVLVSVAVDIAYQSPRAFPVCAAIVSYLLSLLPQRKARIELIGKIHAKLSQLPNTGHMEVWLQRISHSIEPRLGYGETLCQLVAGKTVTLWNSDWITSAKLRAAIDARRAVNLTTLRALNPVIKPKEIQLFASKRY